MRIYLCGCSIDRGKTTIEGHIVCPEHFQHEYGWLSPMRTSPSGQRVIDYGRMSSDEVPNWDFLDDPEFQAACKTRSALNSRNTATVEDRPLAPGFFIGNGAKDGAMP